MIDYIGWALTAGAIVGAILNARRNVFSFYIWNVTNLGFVILNLYTGQYYLVVMFAIYFIISVYGVRNWKRAL